MAQLDFDSSQYNPEQGSGQLSVGRHLVIIEKDEIKKAKENEGGYLELILKGIQKSEGERGAYRINLYNVGPNQSVTRDAAHRQLSAVCHAVGVQHIGGDSSVLHNLPFVVDVGYQKGHNPATDGDGAKGYTQVNRVFYADGSDIVPGQYGAAGGQQQNGGFGNGQNTNQNQGNNGGGFNNQNQNQNQQQDNTQQQQGNNTGNGGNVNFGNNGGNNNGGNNSNQGGNNGGGWTPGQGNTGGGQQWQPRT